MHVFIVCVLYILKVQALQADAYSFSSLVTACRDVWLQAVAMLGTCLSLGSFWSLRISKVGFCLVEVYKLGN